MLRTSTLLGIGTLTAALVATFAPGCGSPSVSANGAGGSEKLAGGEDGGGDGGAELQGVAPSCTDVDPKKEALPESIAIPGGPFLMGCSPDHDQECRADEKPGHMVTLSPFKIDKTETTFAQYFACVQAGACTYPKCQWNPCTDPDLPIACIKEPQAVAYCAWAKKRLPTEAEWEKAARGTDGRKFPWGDDPADCSHTNLLGCTKAPLPVGSLPAGASPFGVLDMSGNVVEWTSDHYDPKYYASAPPSDPHGPAGGGEFSGRGGGFLSAEIWHRASSRDLYETGYTRVSMGVRCAE